MALDAGKLKRAHGFTLIELLVTLVVAVVLATVAIPGFSDLIKNNRIAVASNDVLSLVVNSRNEAIRSRSFVVLEVGASDGWPLIARKDGEVIASRDSPGDGFELSFSSSGLSEIEFGPLGFSSGDNSLCLSVNGVFEKEIRIMPSGQISGLDRGVFENCS